MTITKGQSYKVNNDKVIIITKTHNKTTAYYIFETTPGKYIEDFCNLSDLYRGLYEGWIKPNFNTTQPIIPNNHINITISFN